MTSSRWHNGPVRASRIAMAVGLSAVALTLAACGGAQRAQLQIQGAPRSSSPATPTTAAPSDLSSQGPTVYGKLTVTIAKTTSASVPPKGPITYTLIVKRVSDGEVYGVPVGADGEFAITLRTGTYQVPAIQMESAELAAEPVSVPLTATEQLQFAIPESGCVYGGHVQILYGRVVSGSLARQGDVVQQMSTATHQTYWYVYLATGGLILTGAKIDVPAEADRPAAARSCPVNAFTSVPR
jgi:hypothetical protein